MTNDEMNIQFDKLIVTHELATYMKIFRIMKSIMFTSTLCFLYILAKDIYVEKFFNEINSFDLLIEDSL